MGIILFITVGLLVVAFAILYYNQQRSREQVVEDQLLKEDHDYGTDDVFDLVDGIKEERDDAEGRG